MYPHPSLCRLLKELDEINWYPKVGNGTFWKMNEKIWGKKVSTDAQILDLLKTKSQHHIIKTFHVGASRVNKLAKGIFSIPNHRPKTTSAEEDIFLIAHVRANPLISIDEVVADFRIKYSRKISRNTVIRRLKSVGFTWRAPRKQQLLTRDQIYIRYLFSRELLQEENDFFELVTFSDEPRFDNTPDNQYRWFERDHFSPATTISCQNLGSRQLPVAPSGSILNLT